MYKQIKENKLKVIERKSKSKQNEDKWNEIGRQQLQLLQQHYCHVTQEYKIKCIQGIP